MAVAHAPTPATRSKPRPSTAARRVGYVFGATVNAALLYLVNVWPGWQALSFLTDAFAQVVPWVNLSILVGLTANLVYLVRDPRWLRSVGDLATSVVSFAVLLQLLQVFPFTFTADQPLDALVRVVLVLLVIGTAIGGVASLVALVRGDDT